MIAWQNCARRTVLLHKDLYVNPELYWAVYIAGLWPMFVWAVHRTCVYTDCGLAMPTNHRIVSIMRLHKVLQWWLHCNCWMIATYDVLIVHLQFMFPVLIFKIAMLQTCMLFLRQHDVQHRSEVAAILENEDLYIIEF